MIVVDSSAVVAILEGEPGNTVFMDRIVSAGSGVLSAGSVVELGAVTSKEDTARQALMEFLLLPFVEIEPVDTEQAMLAVEAYRRFGKGHHRARLNLGDVFSYSLARKMGLPLLYKGDDFSLTDIEPAITR